MNRYPYDPKGRFSDPPPSFGRLGVGRSASQTTLDDWTPRLSSAPPTPTPMWVSADSSLANEPDPSL